MEDLKGSGRGYGVEVHLRRLLDFLWFLCSLGIGRWYFQTAPHTGEAEGSGHGVKVHLRKSFKLLWLPFSLGISPQLSKVLLMQEG